jgi:hypothetical protein
MHSGHLSTTSSSGEVEYCTPWSRRWERKFQKLKRLLCDGIKPTCANGKLLALIPEQSLRECLS